MARHQVYGESVSDLPMQRRPLKGIMIGLILTIPFWVLVIMSWLGYIRPQHMGMELNEHHELDPAPSMFGGTVKKVKFFSKVGAIALIVAIMFQRCAAY